MKKLMEMGVASVAFTFLSLASTLVGKEEEIPLDKLPKAVASAIMAKFPGSKLEEAVKETADDTIVYEVELKQKDQEYVVSVTPEGKITEVEREIAVKDLPKAVTLALAKKYPHARLGEAEEAKADEKTTYEIVVSIRVTVDPQGKILKEDAAEREELDEVVRFLHILRQDEEDEDDDGK